MYMPTCLLLPAVAVAALIFDVRTGKIPNPFILVGLIIDLAVSAICGRPDLPSCLAGIFLPFIVLWPFFVLRMLGGGDIKLVMVLGGLVGYPDIARLFFFSVLAGSAIAVVLMLTSQSFAARMDRLGSYIKSMLASGQLSRYPGIKDKEARFPFAVPVFIGTVLYMLSVIQPWRL